jgi:hypothetical protein
VTDKPTPGAATRIKEFARQYGRMSGLDQEQVTRVHSDPGAEPADLLLADLLAVVDALDTIRNLAYRLDLASAFAPDGVQRIFDVAADTLDGWTRGRRPARAKSDPGPHYQPGGGTRTRTCVHCGRRCGDTAGGFGQVDGQPVCHPSEPGRPDCYHLTTAARDQHPLRDCGRCSPGLLADRGSVEPDPPTACYCNATTAPPCGWCTAERLDGDLR